MFALGGLVAFSCLFWIWRANGPAQGGATSTSPGQTNLPLSRDREAEFESTLQDAPLMRKLLNDREIARTTFRAAVVRGIGYFRPRKRA
jgi:hypothetical protein